MPPDLRLPNRPKLWKNAPSLQFDRCPTCGRIDEPRAREWRRAWRLALGGGDDRVLVAGRRSSSGTRSTAAAASSPDDRASPRAPPQSPRWSSCRISRPTASTRSGCSRARCLAEQLRHHLARDRRRPLAPARARSSDRGPRGPRRESAVARVFASTSPATRAGARRSMRERDVPAHRQAANHRALDLEMRHQRQHVRRVAVHRHACEAGILERRPAPRNPRRSGATIRQPGGTRCSCGSHCSALSGNACSSTIGRPSPASRYRIDRSARCATLVSHASARPCPFAKIARHDCVAFCSIVAAAPAHRVHAQGRLGRARRPTSRRRRPTRSAPRPASRRRF